MSIGIDFPIQDKNNQKNLFDLTTLNRQAIKSNLILFLVTKKGERYMRPTFGADLKQFIFEANDDLQREIIEDYIKTEVEREFENITINFVNTQEIDELNDDTNKIEHIMILSIEFTYTNKTFTYNDLVSIEFVL